MFRLTNLLRASAATLAMFGLSTAGRAAAATVAVTGGLVSGVTEAGANAYLGVPFAAAPIGANRWRSPQPVAPWQDVRAADHFGDSC